MQRHRAGRLAVLLSLNKIDSKPDGVERTTGSIVPSSPRQEQAAKGRAASLKPQSPLAEKTPSTVALMEHTASENTIECIGSSDEVAETPTRTMRGKAYLELPRERRNMIEVDSGLEMNLDTAEASSIEDNGSSASDAQDSIEGEASKPSLRCADAEGHSCEHEECYPGE